MLAVKWWCEGIIEKHMRTPTLIEQLVPNCPVWVLWSMMKTYPIHSKPVVLPYTSIIIKIGHAPSSREEGQGWYTYPSSKTSLDLFNLENWNWSLLQFSKPNPNRSTLAISQEVLFLLVGQTNGYFWLVRAWLDQPINVNWAEMVGWLVVNCVASKQAKPSLNTTWVLELCVCDTVFNLTVSQY